ncbi:MAG: alpha-1,2-fucosyltransferase, partial [Rickettsiales bacterium]
MIVTEILSGLGNQLFQYAVAKQLALIKNVPLKLDISFFENQTLRGYKLNHYNIQAEIATSKEVNDYLYIYNSSSFPSKILRKIDLRLPRTKRKFFKEEKPWRYEADLYEVSSNIYIQGYWQHYK